MQISPNIIYREQFKHNVNFVFKGQFCLQEKLGSRKLHHLNLRGGGEPHPSTSGVTTCSLISDNPSTSQHLSHELQLF